MLYFTKQSLRKSYIRALLCYRPHVRFLGCAAESNESYDANRESQLFYALFCPGAERGAASVAVACSCHGTVGCFPTVNSP